TVFYSLLTTLPVYVIDELGGTQSNAGLVVTFMLASAIIVRPFSAKVLDIVGKKRTLVLSVGLFALTTFFYLTINAFIPLLILVLSQLQQVLLQLILYQMLEKALVWVILRCR